MVKGQLHRTLGKNVYIGIANSLSLQRARMQYSSVAQKIQKIYNIRECGSTLYVGMTRTAARAAYRLILK